MPMRDWLIRRIIKAGENIEATLTQAVLVLIAGSYLTVLAFSKRAVDFSLQILTTPTPLWATILLVLLGYGYIYLIFHRSHSSAHLSDKFKDSQVNPISSDGSKTNYFTLGEHKWKVDVYPSGYFRVDRYPICTLHDLKFILKGDDIACPATNCKNAISKYDDYKIRATAESHIEKEIRNNPTFVPIEKELLKAASASSPPDPPRRSFPGIKIPRNK